jgi:hypothetical protein
VYCVGEGAALKTKTKNQKLQRACRAVLLTRLGNADELSDKRLVVLFSPKEAEGQLKVDLICYTALRLISALVLGSLHRHCSRISEQ